VPHIYKIFRELEWRGLTPINWDFFIQATREVLLQITPSPPCQFLISHSCGAQLSFQIQPFKQEEEEKDQQPI